MRAGEGVDRGERISDPGEIRKRRGVNQEEFCSSGIKGARSAKYKLFTLVEDRIGSSKSFQAQIARFRFSPDSGQIAASRRPATKSADPVNREGLNSTHINNTPGLVEEPSTASIRKATNSFDQAVWLDNSENCPLRSDCALTTTGQIKSLKLQCDGTPQGPTTHFRANGDFPVLGD